jgi:hypothetical protein
LFGSPLSSFIQEFLCKIDSYDMSSWTDAFSGWNSRCTHAATNIKNGHTGNYRESIDSPPTIAIPE